MTKKALIGNIVFKFVMFLLFMYFLINTVQSSGWGFFPILFALVASSDFVQGTRLVILYQNIKKNKKKNQNKDK